MRQHLTIISSQKVKKLSVEGNIKRFYLYKIFIRLLFYVPVIVLFWQSRGLTLFQIMLVQAIFSTSMAIFEVPSGVLADIVGKKKCLIIGALGMAFCSFIYASSASFYTFAITGILWGFTATLISGTDSAFLYDTLVQLKRQDEYKKIEGTSYSLTHIAAIFGVAMGGLLAKINLSYPFYVTAFSFILAAVIAWKFVEPKDCPVKDEINQHSYLNRGFTIIKESITTSFINNKIRNLLIYSMLVNGFLSISYMFYQPFMKSIKLPISSFGFIFAVFNIVSALSARYAFKIEKVLKREMLLPITFCVLGVSFFIIGQFLLPWAIIILLLHQTINGYLPPLLRGYLNKEIPSEKRATMLSINNLSSELPFIIFAPLIGRIADVYSLNSAYFSSGIILLLLGLIWGASILYSHLFFLNKKS